VCSIVLALQAEFVFGEFSNAILKESGVGKGCKEQEQAKALVSFSILSIAILIGLSYRLIGAHFTLKSEAIDQPTGAVIEDKGVNVPMEAAGNLKFAAEEGVDVLREQRLRPDEDVVRSV